jgi:hypothetical protein
MLLLLGVFGTFSVPRTEAATGDICGIVGPLPSFGTNPQTGANLMLIGVPYLFVLYEEDFSVGGLEITALIDDAEGDADISRYASFNGANPSIWVDNADADTIAELDIGFFSEWGTAFMDDLDHDFGLEPGTIEPGLATCDESGLDQQDGVAFIEIVCDDPGKFELTSFDAGDTANALTQDYECINLPAQISLQAKPLTVESNPAIGNVSKSLLVATVTDTAGHYIGEGYAVDWTASKCTIRGAEEADFEGDFGLDALFAAYQPSNPITAVGINVLTPSEGAPSPSTSHTFLNDPGEPGGNDLRSIAAAVLHCEGEAPGVASVRAELDRSPLPDLSATVDITVIGPPAFITMIAAPSKVVCGEKATILVTVTDAINQKVSDHNRVELVTNYGGVLGGTGATLGFPGVNPVTPLSSGAAETFGGVATAYLLTSTAHIGSYEVVAAAGGSNIGAYRLVIPVGRNITEIVYDGNTGVFSTPVVTSQVTVTCTEGAPAVTAPSTGTGTISPPNTGDAGLAAANSSSNAMLYVIAGAIAFVMAGLASIRYARR